MEALQRYEVQTGNDEKSSAENIHSLTNRLIDWMTTPDAYDSALSDFIRVTWPAWVVAGILGALFGPLIK